MLSYKGKSPETKFDIQPMIIKNKLLFANVLAGQLGDISLGPLIVICMQYHDAKTYHA